MSPLRARVASELAEGTVVGMVGGGLVVGGVVYGIAALVQHSEASSRPVDEVTVGALGTVGLGFFGAGYALGVATGVTLAGERHGARGSIIGALGGALLGTAVPPILAYALSDDRDVRLASWLLTPVTSVLASAFFYELTNTATVLEEAQVQLASRRRQRIRVMPSAAPAPLGSGGTFGLAGVF
ncbi:MAG: hypothetical protein JNK72_14900 [Myxococcales bacterium]|nr:hypothetical protein [Myxococcales bacterium]